MEKRIVLEELHNGPEKVRPGQPIGLQRNSATMADVSEDFGSKCLAAQVDMVGARAKNPFADNVD